VKKDYQELTTLEMSTRKGNNKLISERRLSVNKTKDSQNETADSGPPFFIRIE